MLLLKDDGSIRAELVRRRVRELRRLGREIAKTKDEIARKLEEPGARLPELRGSVPSSLANILGEAGDVARIRSKAAFALMAGSAAPPSPSKERSAY
jgi:transposase